MTNCRIRDNQVADTFASGAAAVFVNQGKCYIDNSTFDNNVAKGNIVAGGAIIANDNSLLVLVACKISNNRALAVGWCTAGTSRLEPACPSAFGGALLIIRSTVFIMDESNIAGNVASGESFSSTVYGGAVTLMGGNLLLAGNVTCFNNVVNCSGSCVYGLGGCFYVGIGQANIFASVLKGNSVEGIGSGGAVTVSGKGSVAISSSLVTGNFAQEGGGFAVKGTSQLSITSSTISDNIGCVQSFILFFLRIFVAKITAGAVAAGEEGAMEISHSHFSNNTARNIQAIFGYFSLGKRNNAVLRRLPPFSGTMTTIELATRCTTTRS